jgi:hypothetical protein
LTKGNNYVIIILKKGVAMKTKLAVVALVILMSGTAGFAWEIGVEDNDYSEFGWTYNFDYKVGDPLTGEKGFRCYISEFSEDNLQNIHFNVDILQHYRLIIDAFQCPTRNAKFKIKVNDKEIDTPGFIDLASSLNPDPLIVIIKSNLLQIGPNLISLELLPGYLYVMWDYLEFSPSEEEL